MNRCIIKLGLGLLLLVVIGCYMLLFIAYPPKVAEVKVPSNRSLVILLGGFGQHQLQYLLDNVKDGGFASLANSPNGSVGFLRPIFPALSQPNFYSMMTGSFAEQHGVVGDLVYSAEHGIVINPVLEKNANDAKEFPLKLFWEQDKLSAQKFKFFVDPCSNVPWLKTKLECNDNEEPNEAALLDAFRNNLFDAFGQLRDGNTDVALAHTGALYRQGIANGPLQTDTIESLRRVDAILKDLMKNLTDQNMLVYTNVIVASDHGLTSIEEAKIVSIADVVKSDDVLKVVSQGALASIWPADGKRDAVYAKLKNISGIHVWTKDDIPWEFHYKNNDYIAPIQIVSVKGYFLDFHQDMFPKLITYAKKVDHPKGADGYDSREVDDMNGVFLALGPGFSKNMIKPVQTKDFHDVMTKLLLGEQPAAAKDEHKMNHDGHGHH